MPGKKKSCKSAIMSCRHFREGVEKHLSVSKLQCRLALQQTIWESFLCAENIVLTKQQIHFKLKQRTMGEELVFFPMKIQSYYQSIFSQSKEELEH